MHRHNLHSSNAETLRVLRPKPCGFSTPRPRIAKQYVYTPSRGVTLGFLDSAPTYCEAIRVHALQRRNSGFPRLPNNTYALAGHTWTRLLRKLRFSTWYTRMASPYVDAPSRGATRETCDSGRSS